MIGLTAGLVIEGHTGNSILTQVNLLCTCGWPLSVFVHMNVVSLIREHNNLNLVNGWWLLPSNAWIF